MQEPTTDWAAIAAIATAVSVFVSLVFSLLWRFLDNRRAAWAVYDVEARWDSPGNDMVKALPPGAVVTLANTGDGDAFTLTLVGLGCVAWLEPNRMALFLQGPTPRNTLVPRLASGQATNLAVVAEPSAWNRAIVAVIWTASPTRFGWLSRRVDYIPLTRLAPMPVFGRDIVVNGIWTPEREELEPPPEPFLTPDIAPAFAGRPSRWDPIRRWRLGYVLHRHT